MRMESLRRVKLSLLSTSNGIVSKLENYILLIFFLKFLILMSELLRCQFC